MKAWLENRTIARSERARELEAHRRREDSLVGDLAARLRAEAPGYRRGTELDLEHLQRAVAEVSQTEAPGTRRAESFAVPLALSGAAAALIALLMWSRGSPAQDVSPQAPGNIVALVRSSLDRVLPGSGALRSVHDPLWLELELLELDGSRAAAGLVERLPAPLRAALFAQ